MLKILLITLPVLVILLLIVIALQSPNFRITRSTAVSAPPAEVFAQVNDLHKWESWSPWAKLDPAMKQTYVGPASGAGATYSWAGNKAVGEGRMTILESRPEEFIRIKLEFLKPFRATNLAEFAFIPDGNQTAVAWSMSGEKNFMFKAVHLFMGVDKMVGRDFEKGLAALKSVTESAADRK